MTLLDYIQAFFTIAAIITTIYSTWTGAKNNWWVGRKIKAETESMYSKIATESGEREHTANEKIEKLEAELLRLRGLLSMKDDRIELLEKTTVMQEGRIKELETELAQLRENKK